MYTQEGSYLTAVFFLAVTGLLAWQVHAATMPSTMAMVLAIGWIVGVYYHTVCLLWLVGTLKRTRELPERHLNSLYNRAYGIQVMGMLPFAIVMIEMG